MRRSRPVPTCFVVLPLSTSRSLSLDELGIASDGVFDHVERAASGAGFTCVRAEVSSMGEFVEISMRERLLVAELVIADVTSESPSVRYMIGVRDGVASRPTILIAGRGRGRIGPSEPHALDVVTYLTSEDNEIDPAYGDIFEEALTERMGRAIDDESHRRVPLLDATGWSHGGRLEHDKTDVFLERIAETTDIGRRIRDARTVSDPAASIDALHDLEHELLEGATETAALDTGLLGVYIAYREGKAYQHMVGLYDRMPPELQSTPVAREQLALALNRLAEADDGRASFGPLREQALAVLDSLESHLVTAETWAIRGRIYKGGYRCAVAEGDDAEGQNMLDRAIESYEQAVKVDMRDYFPGINAITLRLTRGTIEDLAAVTRLVPVVRVAVDNAPAAHSDQERYWQTATRLELACAAGDWDAASGCLESVERFDVDDWMYETTIGNLEMYRTVLGQDADAVAHLDGIVERLRR